MSRTLLNPKVRRVDVHHHFFTPGLNKVEANSKLGWKTPEENLPWSPKVSLDAMDAMNIDVAILSFPPISSGSIGETNRALARKRNEYVANVCTENPDRFGFFATVPFLDDVNGCLQEIEYAMDQLHAYGIFLASCYGEGTAASK
jgi:predicted TIM-barrel fold metal-dependent hydrolase